MTYDNWKATNPADEEFDIEPPPCEWNWEVRWPCRYYGAKFKPCRLDEESGEEFES